MGTIAQVLLEIGEVEEKFRKIQENPALNGTEFGLDAQENEVLNKLIEQCGAANLAADAISKRVLGINK